MTARPQPPEVEALSDITWARVERRLWAELDRTPAPAPEVVAWSPRRRWPWLAAGALAVVAVVAVLAWPSSSARPAGPLASRVVTASAATEVGFGDAAITVGPDSALLMHGHADQGVSIVIERGSAAFAVAPRSGRPPFVVEAGVVRVRVVGTRFTVTRSGDDARVDVTHGEVEVVARGHREVLLAGASWSSGDVREAVVGGQVTVTNPGDVAAAHFSPPPALPAPVPRRVTQPAPDRDRVGAPRPTPTTPVPVEVAVDPRRAVYHAAEALEVSDPAAALRAYKQVALGNDRWAANALYAAARLAFGQGDRALAGRFAAAYVKRFPTGANTDDARALQLRATGGTP